MATIIRADNGEEIEIETVSEYVKRIHSEMIDQKCGTCVGYQDGQCITSLRYWKPGWRCNISYHEHKEAATYTNQLPLARILDNAVSPE